MFKNLSVKGIGLAGRQSEVIEAALSYRFKGLDLDILEFAEQVNSFGLPHARRLIDSARIAIATFRLPLAWGEWTNDDKDYAKGMAELPKYAELAAQLGCTRCLTTIKPASDERPYHENFEFHRRRIAEIADVLKPRGISLGLEFDATPAGRQGRAFQFIHTFDALVQLARLASATNVGVSVDLWQLYVGGGSIEDLKALPKDFLLAVFLSDLPVDANLEKVDETSRWLPGENGQIDSVAALTTLAELGYEGPVTVLAHPKHLADKNRDEKIRLVADRLNQLWTSAGLNPAGKLAASAG